MDHLTTLPRELLDIVVGFVRPCFPGDPTNEEAEDWEDVKDVDIFTLSLVCKKLRDSCLPLLFYDLKITFDAAGFEKLASVSSSAHIAALVRDFVYCVPQFLKPALGDPEGFARIFSLEDYLYQRAFDLCDYERSGKTYGDLGPLVAQKFRSQNAFLHTDTDLHALRTALPQFRNLHTFTMWVRGSFDSDMEDIPWLHAHIVQCSDAAYRRHLSVCTEALRAARLVGVNVTTFCWLSDSSFLYRPGDSNPAEPVLPSCTLAEITRLQLHYDNDLDKYHFHNEFINIEGGESLSDVKSEVPFPGCNLMLPAAATNLQSLTLDASSATRVITVFRSGYTGILMPALQELSLGWIEVDIDGFEDFLRNHVPAISSVRLDHVRWRSKKQSTNSLKRSLKCLDRVGKAVKWNKVEVRHAVWSDVEDQRSEGKVLNEGKGCRSYRVDAFERILRREIQWWEARKLICKSDGILACRG